jgi:hypothetical protein
LLDAMRDQQVRVVFNGLVTTCRVLRTGHYTVQVDLDAERAAAVLAKLKTVPAVAAAGYLPGMQDMSRAIRFPSAEWRDAAGKLDRDKLSAAIGAAVAKAMAATVSSTAWDLLMGQLTITAKRPEQRVAEVKLSELLAIKFTVGPESPTSIRQSILWIDSVTGQIVDERPDPKLEFFIYIPEATSEEESNEPDGSDGLVEAIVGALKGAAWDTDNERWQQ